MGEAKRAELIAAHWLLAGQRPSADPVPCPADLRTRAAQAAAAGYDGIGLLDAELAHEVARHDAGGVRAIIQDAGLRHVELEALTGWWRDSDNWRRAFDRMATAAQAIGARIIKATGDFSAEPLPVEAMTHAFDRLGHMAREAGIPVALEIIAFSNIADVPTALEVLGGHAGKGAGLMLDSWHFARRDLPLDTIAQLPAAVILGVEISDVGPTIVSDIFTDTLDHRRVPGEGVYPVDAFLRAVAATGYAGPVGLEVLNAGLRADGVPDALRSCAEGAWAIMDTAH